MSKIWAGTESTTDWVGIHGGASLSRLQVLAHPSRELMSVQRHERHAWLGFPNCLGLLVRLCHSASSGNQERHRCLRA
jgi:hypothetical protein